ncbi:DUF7504 family protein [Halomarina salina]|uniref:DUF7504 family protein n=1 Tax=Halomarina salina TaxID=1872699 RepID=UPI003F5E8084
MGEKTGCSECGQLRGSSDVASALQTLKRNGSTLLVTGAVSDTVRAAVTRNLMGHPEENRRRILALIDAERSQPADYLPAGIATEDDETEVLDFRSDIRAATQVQSASSTARPPRRSTEVIRAHLLDAITRARYEESLAPGELRVGVVSLGPLLDEESLTDVLDFVRLLGNEIRRLNGMGHFHLPSEDSELISTLMSSIDARIELCSPDRTAPIHRFHLSVIGETTPWMRL